MRLRILLPRRGGGRGLRGLRRLSVAGAALALAICGCGGSDAPKPSQSPTGTPTAAASATPAAKQKAELSLSDALETRGKHLAAGISEANPNFISASPDIPQPFARWRDELAKMDPALYRIVIYWPSLQPGADAPADLNAVNGGCLRDIPPCAAYAGVRDQLRALASRQRDGGGEGFAMITGSPEWAARPPSGCERRRIGPSNRMPRTDALAAYRKLVADVLALARKEHASVRYWAPWNEPNHPYSSSPQRAYCSGNAPSVSAKPYVQVADALRDALEKAPGDQRYTVGEVAVQTRRLSITTSVHEFLDALPPKLVCGAAAWTQHSYIGGLDVLDDVDRLLASKRCDRKLPIWMTETGAGAPRTSSARTGGRAAERRGCRAVDKILTRWYRDPRITAAVQYTLREDDVFPTGLVTTALDREYPAFKAWQQWGLEQRPNAADPPPAKVDCG